MGLLELYHYEFTCDGCKRTVVQTDTKHLKQSHVTEKDLPTGWHIRFQQLEDKYGHILSQPLLYCQTCRLAD
jgi:hypothetical protein